MAVIKGFEVCGNGLMMGVAIAFEDRRREGSKLFMPHGNDQTIHLVLGVDDAKIDRVRFGDWL